MKTTGTLSNVSDDDKESHEQLVTVSDVILFKFSSEWYTKLLLFCFWHFYLWPWSLRSLSYCRFHHACTHACAIQVNNGTSIESISFENSMFKIVLATTYTLLRNMACKILNRAHRWYFLPPDMILVFDFLLLLCTQCAMSQGSESW